MEKAVHTKAKKEPAPKKIAPTWGSTPQMQYSTYLTWMKHKTTKNAPTTKKKPGSQEGSIRGRCPFSGGGDRRQSLSLKFAMAETSHTICIHNMSEQNF
jgi:hypothetical protein